MAFFKKLKNNIGLEEKKQGEYENEENEALEKEKKNRDNQEGEEENEPTKEKNKKNKDSKGDIKMPMMEKSAFDWLKTKGQLAVDVFQTENEFCVQAPIAGIEQNDIDISIENEMLIIRGERREPILSDKEKKYFYQECYWGPFSRQIILPEDVNSEKIKASLKNGILIIRIPKAEPEKKKIIVEVE